MLSWLNLLMRSRRLFNFWTTDQSFVPSELYKRTIIAFKHAYTTLYILYSMQNIKLWLMLEVDQNKGNKDTDW
jgi:uncharacterized protein YcaQ